MITFLIDGYNNLGYGDFQTNPPGADQMSSFQIEKGLTMPQKPALRGRSKYPFAQMDIGDSFVVQLEHRKSWAFIFTAIGNENHKTGRKFSTRTLEDGSRRVWRVA